MWSFHVIQSMLCFYFAIIEKKHYHVLTSERAQELNWTISMIAFWFFIYQPDMRKHWVCELRIRCLAQWMCTTKNIDSQLVHERGSWQTALKWRREGAPPAVIIEDTSSPRPESCTWDTHWMCISLVSDDLWSYHHLGGYIILLKIKWNKIIDHT